ncbi:site-specific integrase [Massilia oculi]|uniref:Site-specific integrase n=1 Tax=Massilia hydrophila TaxID=3044279 RepID=A0ABS7YGH4_9BURK|nr:site-specific integrase [Massilia oculi]MCA1857435.1 site-specific integrase [Massilia oculi]
MSANLFKVGAVWHYRFQVAGARVQRSTRLRNRTKAEALAQREYDAALVRANGGQPVPTLDELAGAWLVVHRPTASAAHLRSVETFRRLHMYDLGDKPIGSITTEDVELARIEHLKEHRPATANHWLRILKLLTMWAVKRGVLAASPWKVAMIKVQKRPRAVLPMDVARTWFAAVDDASKRAPGVGTAVRLMFGLGLREGEAASARWEWVDWARSTYTPGITKGREAEPVPMPDWLAEHLAPMRAVEGLIARYPNGQQFKPGYARSAMRQANVACSVKGITPHRLRGTFATLLSEAGVPIQTIQKVMRHKSYTTTMGYLEKNLDTAAQAQNRIAQKIGLSWRESGEQQQSNPSEMEMSQ